MKNFCMILGLLVMAISGQAQDATVMPTEKAFYIQSAMNYGQNNGGYWDVPGGESNLKKSATIQVWDLDNGADRKYYLEDSDRDGYYEIKPAATSSSYRIDVSGGEPSMNKNGANIALWVQNNKDWQKFRFRHLGDGRFKIYTTSGMAICLAGRSNDNGSNVHLWEDHNGNWMEWHLIDAETKQAFIPTPAPEKPEYFIANKDKTFKYKQASAYVSGSEGTATVKETTDNKVVMSVTSTGRNPMNGEMETNTFDYEIKYENGVYSRGSKDDYYEKGVFRTNNEGVEYLVLQGAQSSVRLTPMAPQQPQFFVDNKDKTFEYKQSLAFVEGSEGTAVVKEILDDHVVLSITATGRNPMTGEMETNTFDYEIKYENGEYFRGKDGDYPEKGEIRTDDNGNPYLTLSGEQSVVSFKIKE
jgi:hypothetical protein